MNDRITIEPTGRGMTGMLNRRSFVTASLALGAGCSRFTSNKREETTSGRVGTGTSTFSMSSTPTKTPTSTPYDASIETGNIVLRLSDIPEYYQLSGENVTTESAAGSQESAEGLVKLHERAFRRSQSNPDNNLPEIIIASVYVYESVSTSKQANEAKIGDNYGENAQRATIDIGADTSGTLIKFERSGGLKATMLFSRKANLVLQLLVGDSEAFLPDLVERWFAKMLADI